jgi:NAD(P)H-hydrate epimerase
MGDVLSGVIAAFMARGLSGFDAACLGVYSHGRAGDLLVESGIPFGYLASELADSLPEVWQELLAG